MEGGVHKLPIPGAKRLNIVLPIIYESIWRFTYNTTSFHARISPIEHMHYITYFMDIKLILLLSFIGVLIILILNIYKYIKYIYYLF